MTQLKALSIPIDKTEKSRSLVGGEKFHREANFILGLYPFKS